MDTLEDIAIEFLEKVTLQLDPYTRQKGVIENRSSKPDLVEVVLLTPSHIQFAKYGRGPGKNPPLDPLLEWVNRKGVLFDGTDERGTAFALQKMIAKDGTKNWKRNAPNALEEALQSEFLEFNAKTGKALGVIYQEQLDGIYKNLYPKEVKFEI